MLVGCSQEAGLKVLENLEGCFFSSGGEVAQGVAIGFTFLSAISLTSEKSASWRSCDTSYCVIRVWIRSGSRRSALSCLLPFQCNRVACIQCLQHSLSFSPNHCSISCCRAPLNWMQLSGSDLILALLESRVRLALQVHMRCFCEFFHSYGLHSHITSFSNLHL